MNQHQIEIGDAVSDSPQGAGEVTGITDAGYPRVNHVAVAWLERPDGARFDPFNQHGGSRAGTQAPAGKQEGGAS